MVERAPRSRALLWITGSLGLLLLPVDGQVRVMSPEALVRKFEDTAGRIEGSTATFGAPFYGDRVLGRLVYGKSKHNRSHCKEDDYAVPEQGPANEGDVKLINIVMVRRGQCSFTTKVRVAYAKGAHAVVIVDKEDSPLKRQDLRNIIVADDGYGDKIHIPSILISKADGNLLIDAVLQNQVIVELAWDLPTNHVVKTDLWMSSASRESLRFLKDFSPKRKVLNEVVIFQPHYAVFGMEKGDPNVYNGLCMDETGTFCAEDPDGPGPITGRDVLMEDVRQLCIHDLYKKARTSANFQPGQPAVEYASEYWDYVEQFLEKCPVDAPANAAADAKFGEACSKKLMQATRVDVAKVQQCAEVTRDQKLQSEKSYPAWSPRALRINGWRYSGILDADLVTRAICSGFINQPQECKDILAPRNPFKPYTGGGNEEGVTYSTFFSWLFGTVGVGFLALLLYKRYLRKQMQISLREEVMLEVREQMGEYRKMQGV